MILPAAFDWWNVRLLPVFPPSWIHLLRPSILALDDNLFSVPLTLSKILDHFPASQSVSQALSDCEFNTSHALRARKILSPKDRLGAFGPSVWHIRGMPTCLSWFRSRILILKERFLGISEHPSITEA